MVKFCPECSSRYDEEGLEICPEDGARLRSIVDESDDDMIGRVLDDRWEIEERLGKGGMGTVYLARQTTVDRLVAVKMLRPALTTNESYVERFMREANVATTLNHPHCITVFDFGQTEEELLYLVMEFLDGHPLADHLEDENLTLGDILTIGTQICSALSAAHEANIVHRDLKPDNVYLLDVAGGGQFVKVLDFGISKVLDSDATPVTQTGQIFGTPAYMSPEQCQSADVDPRSDLYSLGIILYELVSGRPPFFRGTPIKTLMAHMNSEVRPLRDFGAPLPGDIEGVILKLLEKKPADRFQSAAEVSRRLEEIARNLDEDDAQSVPANHVDFAESQSFGPRLGEGEGADSDERDTTEVWNGSNAQSGRTEMKSQPGGGVVAGLPETKPEDLDDVGGVDDAESSPDGSATSDTIRTNAFFAILGVLLIAGTVVAVYLFDRPRQSGPTDEARYAESGSSIDSESTMDPDEAVIRNVADEPKGESEGAESSGEQTEPAEEQPDDGSQKVASNQTPGESETESGQSDGATPVEKTGEEQAESVEDDDTDQSESSDRASDDAERQAGDESVSEQSAGGDGSDDQNAATDEQNEDDESNSMLPSVLTSKTADKVIRSKYPAIQRCYQQGLRDDPDFGGEVAVKMVVSDKGNVVSAKLTDSKINHTGVENCILKEVETWSFPEPADGFFKNLTHTFNFGS